MVLRMKPPPQFQPIIRLEGERSPADQIAERMVWAMHQEVVETMNTERTAQDEIGISEIGRSCLRCLARHLSLLYSIKDPSWKAQIGTFAHAGLEEHLRRRYQAALDASDPRPDVASFDSTVRYLREVDPNAILHLEEDVALPLKDGSLIPGHCDLFIEGADYGIVWDHKILGAKSLADKRKHIGEQYDTQLDGYGLGMELRGFAVTHVALGALPRDGHVNEAVFVLRPYNRQRVVDRLALIENLKEAACGRFEVAEEQGFFSAFK
jgi:hypothetical protein